MLKIKALKCEIGEGNERVISMVAFVPPDGQVKSGDLANLVRAFEEAIHFLPFDEASAEAEPEAEPEPEKPRRRRRTAEAEPEPEAESSTPSQADVAKAASLAAKELGPKLAADIVLDYSESGRIDGIPEDKRQAFIDEVNAELQVEE